MSEVGPGSRARATAVEAATYLAGFATFHALSLIFINPGYYDPLWPHHGDHYMAVSHAETSFRHFLRWPRPAGQIYLWAVGHLGLAGSLAATISLLALNCALVLVIARRVLALPVTPAWVFCAAAFIALVVVHRYQYEAATWDAFAFLSLFLLLLATLIYIETTQAWLAGGLVVLAFLAKETFILSAGFAAFAWFVTRPAWDRRAVLPLVAVSIAGCAVIAYNIWIGSPQFGNVYKLDFRPLAVLSQWSQFYSEGFGAYWLLALAAILAALRLSCEWRSDAVVFAVTVSICGALALAPNSVVVNHHYPMIMFAAAFLVYAPVLALPAVRFQRAQLILTAAAGALAIGGAIAGYAQAAPSRAWVFMNEQRQKTLIASLRTAFANVEPGQRVLISGLTFTFSPFDHWLSAGPLFKLPRDVKLVIVRQIGPPRPEIRWADTAGRRLTWIEPADVERTAVDVRIRLREDGHVEK